MGVVVAHELANRGAQIIFLVKNLKNPWLIEYIDDLRTSSKNNLVYAEECDLESLYSIRKFTTKWLDNSPPRRLDMIICLAGLALPPFHERTSTLYDGIETQYSVNYLGHYHLLTMLEPALKIQPPDRDVRIILTNCVASVMGKFDENDLEYKSRKYPSMRPWLVFGSAKLQLALFAYEFQRRLNTYVRPDNKKAPNVRLIITDPGLMRTPSFNRFASMGSLLGLFVYLIMWPIWWLFLKSPSGGAQSTLYAAMSPEFEEINEVGYVTECKIRPPPPVAAFKDEELQKRIYDKTSQLVKDVEQRSAKERKRGEISAKVEEARQKKADEKAEKEKKEKKALEKRLEKLNQDKLKKKEDEANEDEIEEISTKSKDTKSKSRKT